MNRALAKNISSIHKALQSRQRRRRFVSSLVWGGLGVGLAAVLGLLLWPAIRPALGEAIDLSVSTQDHIPEGTPPGPYPFDPPAGGAHYSRTLPAKFYEESDLPSLPKYPEGYLVHNLEHGHVIFWYNCNKLDESDCSGLKGQIRTLMEEFDGFKVVAFPWKAQQEPVIMTSWGKMQRFDNFDLDQARKFIYSNRNRGPEPNAP
ncbi:MAG TPA: DUF3105 domain-containing protein [Anaerolineales bacterium]